MKTAYKIKTIQLPILSIHLNEKLPSSIKKIKSVIANAQISNIVESSFWIVLWFVIPMFNQ